MDVKERVQAFRDGDQAALDGILGPLLPRMERRIRHQLRDLGDRWAEDAITKLYSKDWVQALSNYEPEMSSVEAYLFGVVRNVVRDARQSFAESRAGKTKKRGWEVLDSELGHAGDEEDASRFDRLVANEGIRDEHTEAPSLESQILLELLFRVGGYPHQQIAFGFSILIHGKEKRTETEESTRVAVWGDPGRVVEEYSKDALQASFEELVSLLRTHSGYPEALLSECRGYVDARLVMTLGDLFYRDAGSRKSFEDMLDRITGATRVEDYFKSRSGTLAVADWCDKVKNRIARAFEDPSTLKRNPIPFSREGEEPGVA